MADLGLGDYMPYGLPPPWDPGFAMPKNVLDEGIERRALVTKLIPRGTYDDATDGTAGYAVPGYVLDEGTGQGTFTTKWQPSGTYNGPALPNWLNRRPKVVKATMLPGGARQVTVQPLSGDDQPLPALYENYGTRAAAIIMNGVARFPRSQQSKALRTVMDRLDKSLWGRTQTIWKRYIAQGVTPADALPLALARALSAGVAAEIVNAGLTRSAPQVSSLLGLGSYSSGTARGALGGPLPVATNAVATGGVIGGQLPPMPAKLCDPPAGYTWAYGPGTPWHIERLRAGATPVKGPCDANGNPVKVKEIPHEDPTKVNVGGFAFDATNLKPWAVGSGDNVDGRDKPPRILIAKASDLTDKQAAALRRLLTQPYDKETLQTYKDNQGYSGYSEPDAEVWFSRLGLAPDAKIGMHLLHYLHTASSPLFWVTSSTGERLVVHVQLALLDKRKAWDAMANPLVLKLWLSRQVDPAWWVQAIHTIAELPRDLTVLDPTGITDIVFDTVGKGAVAVNDVSNAITDAITNAVKDATCAVAKSDAGKVAGAAAAAYVGAPPQAGVAGAQIAANQCGGQSVPQPTPLPVQSSVMPLVLIGGGVLAAMYLITKRPKVKAQATKRLK